MKLYIATLALFVTALSFASCKKDHKCVCYSASLNRTVSFNIEGKKSDAKEECKAAPVTGSYVGTDFRCNLD